jgi:hypothetical protein
MNYYRRWRNFRAAVGVGGGCAQLVSARYTGTRKPTIVAALQLMATYERGLDIKSAVAADIHRELGRLEVRGHRGREPGEIDKLVIHAMRRAIAVLEAVTDAGALRPKRLDFPPPGKEIGRGVNAAVIAALAAGAEVGNVQRIYARRVARDLGIELLADEQIHVVIAALVAGDEQIIRELFGKEPTR